MNWALGSKFNSDLTLQLPSVLLYTRDVMLNKFQMYVSGNITMG